MKPLEALQQLQRHRYGTLEDFDKKLSIIEKSLKALEIIKKFAIVDNGEIYITSHEFIDLDDEPIITEIDSKEEYELLKEILND